MSNFALLRQKKIRSYYLYCSCYNRPALPALVDTVAELMASTAGTVKGSEATVVGCEYEAIIVGVVISVITADENTGVCGCDIPVSVRASDTVILLLGTVVVAIVSFFAVYVILKLVVIYMR